VTNAVPTGLIIYALAFLAGIFTMTWAKRAVAHQQRHPQGNRTKAAYSDQPLLYTADAAKQRAQLGLNVELVETALAFPNATGGKRGTPVAWYVREFGNKRIKVWTADTPMQRPTIIIRIEVTPTDR